MLALCGPVPMMLLLSVSDRPLGQNLTSDIMTTELVRSLAGAMALVLSVPLTTWIAVLIVPRRAPRHDRLYPDTLVARQ